MTYRVHSKKNATAPKPPYKRKTGYSLQRYLIFGDVHCGLMRPKVNCFVTMVIVFGIKQGKFVGIRTPSGLGVAA